MWVIRKDECFYAGMRGVVSMRPSFREDVAALFFTRDAFESTLKDLEELDYSREEFVVQPLESVQQPTVLPIAVHVNGVGTVPMDLRSSLTNAILLLQELDCARSTEDYCNIQAAINDLTVLLGLVRR